MHTFVFSYLLKRLVITTVSRDCKSNGHDSLMQYLYTVASKGFSMLSLLFFGFFFFLCLNLVWKQDYYEDIT